MTLKHVRSNVNLLLAHFIPKVFGSDKSVNEVENKMEQDVDMEKARVEM